MIGSEKFRGWMQHPGFNGGGSGGQTSKTSIPNELKPLAAEYTAKATAYGQQEFDPYTGDRYAPLNDTQNLGIGMIQDRALNGSGTIGNAEGALNQYIGGQSNPYLSQYDQFIQGQPNPYSSQLEGFMDAQPNPYLDQMFNQGANQVQNRLDSNFALAGRTGSNSHAETYQRGLNDLATNIYGGAYDQDRSRAMNAVGMGMNQANTDTGNRMQALGTAANFRNSDVGNQMQAIGMSPTFGNMPYQDAGQLLNAGQMQQDNAQNNLDFGYQQYQDYQNLPLNQLSAMGNVFNSNLGSKTTTSGGGK